MMFDPRPAFVHGWVISHHGEEPAVQNVDAEALTSVDDRLHRMEQFGVDHVLVVHYTLAFAAMSYIFFLGRLTGKLGMRTLVLGQDAAMGKGREGDVKHIANLAAATGVFELDVVDDRGPGEVRIPRISIGTKPTFSEKTGLNERVVEAYCITEEWIDLYDHKVRVEFVGFLRPQVKFDGPDQLVDELKRNVEETKRLTA